MKIQKIKIPNSLGTSIAAVVTYPDTNPERLAILCPGFLDTKDYDHLVKLSESLASRGYAVARFDPTGTWESEGSTSDYLTSQYLKDIKSIVDYMVTADGYKKIILGGHSRGGMVSILYATKDPRISAVFGIMPAVTNMEKDEKYAKWEKDGFSVRSRDIPGTNERKEFRVPFTHAFDREQYDVLNEAKNIHIPILLIAGETDELVSPDEVKQFFDLANEPKKYIMIKGVGHDYRFNPSEIKTVNDLILKWLPK